MDERSSRSTAVYAVVLCVTALLVASMCQLYGTMSASSNVHASHLLKCGHWYKTSWQNYRVNNDGQLVKSRPGWFRIVAPIEPGFYVTENSSQNAILNVYLSADYSHLATWPVTGKVKTARRPNRQIMHLLACFALDKEYRTIFKRLPLNPPPRKQEISFEGTIGSAQRRDS